MKKAKDILLSFDKLDKERVGRYIEDYDIFNWTLIKSNEKIYVEDIINLIKEAQIDAIQHTVKVCADEAELNYGEDEGQSTEIDKQSILSVADKLIKEINETH